MTAFLLRLIGRKLLAAGTVEGRRAIVYQRKSGHRYEKLRDCRWIVVSRRQWTPARLGLASVYCRAEDGSLIQDGDRLVTRLVVGYFAWGGMREN